MTLLLRAALCCLAAISLGGCAYLPGFVDRTWADLEPQLIPVINTAILALVGGAIATAGGWAAAALKAIQRRELFAALYRGMDNGLKAAFARKIATGTLADGPVPGDVVKQALDYLKENGAREVSKLAQFDTTLIDKLLARAPEARAAVLWATTVTPEAAVKVEKVAT